MKTRSKIILALSIVTALSVASVSCGKSNYKFVTDVKLKSYQENGEAFAEALVVINTGSIQLPAFDFPIANPMSPGVSYGRVAMRPAAGGGTELDVAVNLSKIPGMPGFGDGTLPNGKRIPLGGVDPEDVMSFPVANTGVRVYVYFTEGVAMIGAAIPIQQFDKFVGMVGAIDLFIPFDVKGVRGTAGVFSSKNEGQSGLGLFIDAGKLLEEVTVQQALAQAGVAADGPRVLTFEERHPSAEKEKKVFDQLSKWHKQKTQMDLAK
jgi:hypothetical protein